MSGLPMPATANLRPLYWDGIGKNYRGDSIRNLTIRPAARQNPVPPARSGSLILAADAADVPKWQSLFPGWSGEHVQSAYAFFRCPLGGGGRPLRLAR